MALSPGWMGEVGMTEGMAAPPTRVLNLLCACTVILGLSVHFGWGVGGFWGDAINESVGVVTFSSAAGDFFVGLLFSGFAPPSPLWAEQGAPCDTPGSVAHSGKLPRLGVFAAFGECWNDDWASINRP